MTTPPAGDPPPPGPRAGAGAAVLLALRFLLELALLAAWLVGGSAAVGGGPGWVLGGVLALVVAVAWGVLLSPRRRVRLPVAVRVAIELLLFAGAALLLAAAGLGAAAAALMVAEVVVLAALRGPDRNASAWD